MAPVKSWDILGSGLMVSIEKMNLTRAKYLWLRSQHLQHSHSHTRLNDAHNHTSTVAQIDLKKKITPQKLFCNGVRNDKGSKVSLCPPNSPDLSPNGHLWNVLDQGKYVEYLKGIC